MRRLIMFCAAVLLSSCASNAVPEAAPAPQTTVRVNSTLLGGSGKLTITPSGGPRELTVGAAVDRIWGVLPTIYDSLAIPLGIHDPQAHVIGNEGFKIRRTLGKTRLSKYLSCGRSQMEQNADEYEITMAVVTRLVPIDSQQTKVTTSVEASAKGWQFAGQGTNCASTGVLETRMQELLRTTLSAN